MPLKTKLGIPISIKETKSEGYELISKLKGLFVKFKVMFVIFNPTNKKNINNHFSLRALGLGEEKLLAICSFAPLFSLAHPRSRMNTECGAATSRVCSLTKEERESDGMKLLG